MIMARRNLPAGHLRAYGFRIAGLLMVVLTASLPSLCAAQATEAKAGADTIVFANGDRLTGKLVSEAAGKVVFHSDIAGDVTVPWSKVRQLQTAQKMAVITDGQKLKLGRPAPEIPVGTIDASSEQVAVATGAGDVRNIPSSSVAYLVGGDEFQRTLMQQPGLLHGWNGALTLGASLVQATQTSRTFTGSLGLVRTVPHVDWLSPRHRTTFDATASYGLLREPFIAGVQAASSAKSNILHGDLEQDEYLSKRFYVLADASADHNLSSGLRVQQNYGAGAGATLIERPRRTLDVKGDIHYEKQNFYPASGFPGGRTLNLVGANIGESFMQKLPRGLVLTQSGVVQPAFNVPSAYTAQTIAALAFPVYRRLAFSLGAQDNFLNNPPKGYRKNTFQFTAGLTYALK